MVETGSKHSPSLFSSLQNNLDLCHVVLLEKYLIYAHQWRWANHVFRYSIIFIFCLFVCLNNQLLIYQIMFSETFKVLIFDFLLVILGLVLHHTSALLYDGENYLSVIGWEV